MDCIINVKVRGNHLSKDNRNAGVQHEANVTHLRIDFDEGWDGYAKTVTFWDALMGNPTKVLLTTDKLVDIIESTRIYQIAIPGEALTEAGYPTFVIDGFVDGKRKRSLGDTLWVKEAPYEENAGEPSDPTPSQAEQLQVQIDQIIDTIQDAETAKGEAIAAAEYAKNQADSAAMSAQFAQEMADYTYRVKEEAVAAKEAIENMTVSAETLGEGEEASVSKTIQNGVVNLHFGIPRGEDGADSPGNSTGDMLASVYDPQKKAKDIFEYTDDQFALVERAKTGGEIDQRLQNRVEKTGDTMTGILTFDTPGLFSAIQKKRTINGVNYIMRLGIGNDGNGASACLRLFSVEADGTETVVSNIEADSTGVYWVSPGGIRKTIAHSGNIGLLQSSVV